MNGIESALNTSIEEALPSLPFRKTAPLEDGRIRVLHVMGHLLRGGIEVWLYQMIQRLDPHHFAHHILVRTDQEEPFTETFREAGVRVIPCLNYRNPVQFALNFLRVLRQNGPYDVVHIHGSSLSGVTCLLTARLSGVKRIIVHSHNDLEPLLKESSLPYRIYCRVVAAFYRMVPDLGFACSERAARSLYGPQWSRGARFRLLYYGVDFAPFAAQPDLDLRRQLDLPEGAFVIGHVGRFAEQKNHEFILDIAETLVDRVPSAHFLLIGDGPLRPQITAEMERRGLRQHFTLVPDTMAVAGYMRSAMDCFLLPSRYEGLGLVAVEAQAAGLPCLLSDRIPAEAFIDLSRVNVLSLDQPAEEWAKCLEALRDATPVSNAAERMDMFLASRFNVQRCADQLAATYEAMASASRQRDLKSA